MSHAAHGNNATVALKEGEIYHDIIRFDERNWPLPAGDWELLTYIRKTSPLSTGQSFRLALAKFNQERKVTAIIMYGVGEVGDAPGAEASTSDEFQEPDLAYQGEHQIHDDNTDYACWQINVLDLEHLSADPLYDALRLKLQKTSQSEFLAVESVKKYKGLIAHTLVWLSPSTLLPESSKLEVAAPKLEPWSEPGLLAGTKLSVMMMLREWAIRWQERIQVAFEDSVQTKMNLSPLPILHNPRRDIPLMPDLGLRLGETFSDTIPIGPLSCRCRQARGKSSSITQKRSVTAAWQLIRLRLPTSLGTP